MNNQSKAKKIKTIREMEEIASEKKKIQQLLRDANWSDLNAYLNELYKKYWVETSIYNLANQNPPQNTQENAINCIAFLDSLLASKAVEATK